MSKLYPLYKRYLEILEFVISRSDCIFIDLFIYLFIYLFIVFVYLLMYCTEWLVYIS